MRSGRQALAPLAERGSSMKDSGGLSDSSMFRSPQLAPITSQPTEGIDSKFKSPQLTTRFRHLSESVDSDSGRETGGDSADERPLVDRRFENKGKEAVREELVDSGEHYGETDKLVKSESPLVRRPRERERGRAVDTELDERKRGRDRIVEEAGDVGSSQERDAKAVKRRSYRGRELNRDNEVNSSVERDLDMMRARNKNRQPTPERLSRESAGRESVEREGRSRVVRSEATEDAKPHNQEGMSEQDKRLSAIKARARERLRSESRDRGSSRERGGDSDREDPQERLQRRELQGAGSSRRRVVNDGAEISSDQQEETQPAAVDDEDDIDIKAIIALGEKIKENMKAGAKMQDVVAEADTSNASILVAQPAENMPLTEWSNRENEVYIRTLNLPVLIPGENGQPFVPRYLQEEGLFVGDKPIVSYWNSNRLEQRLLREDPRGKKWFGPDGRMDNQPDPLKVTSERLMRWYDPDGGFLRTHFVAPSTAPAQLAHLPVGDQLFQLDIDIVDIQFYDHPLFCEEDLMASQLRLLHAQYVDRAKLDLWEFYTNKLRGLQDSYKTLKSISTVPVSGSSIAPSRDFRKFQSLRRSSNWKAPIADPTMNEMDTETRMNKLAELRERIRQTRETRVLEAQTDVQMIQKMTSISTAIKKQMD